jgi:PleD family two-component response regulator
MEKPLVLIIEDDRDIVALFRHVLDIAGYHTEIVMDGRDAMERLMTIRPDVVLLDMQLPGISGVDILNTIRADERLRATPVVVITAHSNYSDIFPIEPDLFLLKPVDIYQLSDLVQRLKPTHGFMREEPYEKATGLYTFDFFTVRLTFAFERIKQTGVQCFGVLFAAIDPFDALKTRFGKQEFNGFLREMADRFKSTLRPTDTIAWWEDGCFLTLVEEVRTHDVPLKIAERVWDSLADFFEQKDTDLNLRANLGVLICDSKYANVDEILSDVRLARELLRNELTSRPTIYDRDSLFKNRQA